MNPFKYQGTDGLSEVTIDNTGDRYQDFKLANAEAGFDKTPAGYTWHHHQDGHTMQLVETRVHNAIPHTGGSSNAKH
jgi:hypothetical protein